MYRAAVFTLTPLFAAIELLEDWREIFDDALQLNFRAINQTMAVGAIPFESVERSLGARHLDDYADGIGWALRRVAHMLGQEKNFSFFNWDFERRLAFRFNEAKRYVAFELIEKL